MEKNLVSFYGKKHIVKTLQGNNKKYTSMYFLQFNIASIVIKEMWGKQENKMERGYSNILTVTPSNGAYIERGD